MSTKIYRTIRSCLPLFLILPSEAVVARGYLQPLFPAVQRSDDIQYGSALNSRGETENLLLDIYQPAGDCEARRPVIVFIHGGGFMSSRLISILR